MGLVKKRARRASDDDASDGGDSAASTTGSTSASDDDDSRNDDHDHDADPDHGQDDDADMDAGADGADAADMPMQVVMCEPVQTTQQRGSKTYYHAVRYAGDFMKVGDAVELSNPGGLAHLGRIESLYTNAKRDPLMSIQWFYRLSDFPPELQRRNNFAPNEVFLSDHRDANPVQSILNKCIVHSDGAPPLPPGRTAQYVCNKSYSINSQPIKLEPLPKDALLDGNRQLQNTLESGQPIRLPSARERARQMHALYPGHRRQKRRQRRQQKPGADATPAEIAAAQEASKKRRSRNSNSSDYGIMDITEQVAPVAVPSGSSGSGRSDAPTTSASASSASASASSSSASASAAAASAGAPPSGSKRAAPAVPAPAKPAKAAAPAAPAPPRAPAPSAPAPSPHPPTSLAPAASTFAASTPPAAPHVPEVPIDPLYQERLRQFRQQQLAAPSAVPAGKAGDAAAVGAGPREPALVPVRPLDTADGPYDVGACLSVLGHISRASLIRPSVEQAVSKLLLGVSWDSTIAVWTLSALDLCARDNDLAECAESLNILFNASPP